MRRKRTTKADREIERLRRDCAEAYQVVGVLATEASLSNNKAITRALDNLAAAVAGDPRPHEDLLPFPTRLFSACHKLPPRRRG